MGYSVFLGFAGWYLVPNFATKYALQFLHQFLANVLHIAPPKPGTPAYLKHYRYTYASMVLGYLLYNLIEGQKTLPANFYEVLGVYPDVDEAGLKAAFRQFAKRNHPDRVGPGGESLFITVRDVYESLRNPVVRFAYDRFGPDVLDWDNLSTSGEYLHHGLLHASGYHLVAGMALLFWSSVGRPSPVKFWRYILYLGFFVSELALLVYPSPSSSASIFVSGSILHVFFPKRVAFQHILLLHQLFMFLTTALTQVAPVLFPNDQPNEQDMILQQLNALAGAADREASILLHTELHSIHPASDEARISTARLQPHPPPSADVIEQLSHEMENMMIERQVMQGVGPLRSAWENAVKQGRSRLLSAPSQMSGSLPSPVSPTGSPPRQVKPDGVLDQETRLPSPRPSPPPPLHRKGSSYARARSVSY